MNFIADEGVDLFIVQSLRKKNHQVYYIAEEQKSISDDKVLKIASRQKAVLITSDIDFGELVYRLNKVHHGVILLRLEGLKPKTKVEIILKVISEAEAGLKNAFIVVLPSRYKIRSHEF